MKIITEVYVLSHGALQYSQEHMKFLLKGEVMDIKKLADVKDRFADYEKIFNSGDYDKAADILSAILERIEECTDERKAGTMDDTFVKNRTWTADQYI